MIDVLLIDGFTAQAAKASVGDRVNPDGPKKQMVPHVNLIYIAL